MDTRELKLDEYKINYLDYIDRAIIVYGGSECGKSSVILDFLYAIKDYVDQVFLFSPSEVQLISIPSSFRESVFISAPSMTCANVPSIFRKRKLSKENLFAT